MLEKDIENLIARYPDEFFPGENFKLIGQQYFIAGRRVDIVFEDKFKRKIIVEIKRGILTREASGQIAEYYRSLKEEKPDEAIELILCANIIPEKRKNFLENIGISCKEVSVEFLSELAVKHDYVFLDARPSFKEKIRTIEYNTALAQAGTIDGSSISVWFFQTNPQRYDILSALSDKRLGNRIRWSVSQYKDKIRKGHIGLIWMSGREAGIYALARVETDPTKMDEFPLEERYWLQKDDKEKRLRVELTILRRFINNPILKKTLVKIPGLEKLSIIRRPQGTNFPVTDREWKILSQLF